MAASWSPILRVSRSKAATSSFFASPARQPHLNAATVYTVAHANGVSPRTLTSASSFGALPCSSRNFASWSLFGPKKAEVTEEKTTGGPGLAASPASADGSSSFPSDPSASASPAPPIESTPPRGSLSPFFFKKEKTPEAEKAPIENAEKHATENAEKTAVRSQEKTCGEAKRNKRSFFGRCKTVESGACDVSSVCTPPKKVKVPLFSRLRSFMSGFLIASGCAFYVIYYQLDEATVHLHVLAKDAAYRMASVEKKLHALERKIEHRELGKADATR